MRNVCLNCFFVLMVVVLIVCSQVQAEIAVTNSDIVDYHYVYDMNYAEMEESSPVFDADVHSQLHVETENDSWGSSHYLKCFNGFTDANFVLKFDFSSCDLNPFQVQLRDKISLFNTQGNQDCNMVTEWSTDGINYTTINSATSPGTGGSNTQTQNIVMDIPGGAKIFYYRMQANAMTGTFYQADNQWNRVLNSAAEDFFKLDFALRNYSGGSGTEEDPYVISTPYDLSSIGKYPDDWNKHFIVINDINMATVAPEDFHLIAPTFGIDFVGTFDGKNHCISNLTLERNLVGQNTSLALFCQIYDQGVVKNIILKDPDFSNLGPKTGAITGYNKGVIENCHVIGGNISGVEYVGGIAAIGWDGNILRSSSTANVYGSSGNSCSGGILGINAGGNQISNCYASGSVESNGKSGGLVGKNDNADIQNCYSCAYVQGSTNGGLVAEQINGGTTQNSFWDTEVSGQSSSAAGTGLTTEEMMDVQNYIVADWDFISIWNIIDSRTYPMHRKYLSVDTDYDGDVDFYDFSSFAENWLNGVE